jgi:long-chain acyl-CoA synthetase
MSRPAAGSTGLGERALNVETKDRPWLAHYPPGVPAEISPDEPRTVVRLFEDCVAKFATRPALESFGVRRTYAQLGVAARQVGVGLQQLGLKRGDRVAIMMPNVMAYEPVLFGTLLAGYVVVNVNPQYTPRELAHQLNDSGARVLFVLENFAHTVQEALPDLEVLERAVIVTPGDLLGLKGFLVNFVSSYVKRTVKPYRLPASLRFSQFYAWAERDTLKPVEILPDDIAFLQYTGGTTGLAKGAVLLHRNVAANVAQSAGWLEPQFGVHANHVMLTALPLYHVLALTACCLFMIRIGALQVLVANPRDLPALVKTLKSHRFTLLVLVNTLYNALCNQPDIEEVDFSHVVACVAGGLATQAAVAARWKKVSGKPIIEGYGLSETSPVVCVNRLDIDAFTGTIGYPSPSTEISIRSPDGAVVAPGEPGEICIRGPQVMAGYWNQPEESRKAMTADGFFRSGDIGVALPDGAIRIVDRLKDMIIVSGMKVFPNEVEDVLTSHPKVLEAAVIGLPDAHSGECVVAYIVRRDASLTVEDIREFCRQRLTGYKTPRRIEFRDALPKTNVGKILRRALRDEAMAVSTKS